MHIYRKRNVCKRIQYIEGDVIPISTNYFPFSEVIVIPRGHVWLAGDNTNNSTDSRQYGPVPTGLIQGRVFAKFSFNNLSQPFTRIESGPPPKPTLPAKMDEKDSKDSNESVKSET